MNASSTLSRRDFIHQAAGLALAAGSITPWVAAGEEPNEKPRWILACRDAHLPALGTPDCWSAMKALGVTGVEVEVTPELACPGLFHPDKKYRVDTAESRRTLQEDLAAQGAVITAFLMHNRFEERTEQEVRWMEKLVQAAPPLGVSVVRIDVVPHVLKRDEFLVFAIQTAKRLCALVEGTPIRYGIENHGNTTNDPTFLEALFDGAGSAHLGLTLDALNLYWFGHPLSEVYAFCEKFAPRVFHTHCKSLHYPADQREVKRPLGWEYDRYSAPVYEGDIDFRRIAGILRRAGYRGDICLENECLGKFPKPERPDVLKKEIAWLKQAMA